MGGLHEGHLALIKECQRLCDTTIVSIFLNPLQFAEHEDIDKYPQTFQEDLVKLDDLGVDYVFTPSKEVMGVSKYADADNITQVHTYIHAYQ